MWRRSVVIRVEEALADTPVVLYADAEVLAFGDGLFAVPTSSLWAEQARR